VIRHASVHSTTIKPIILKQLMLECDISQNKISEETGLARTTINLVVNACYIPRRQKTFKSDVETFISNNRTARKWLTDRGIGVKDIWNTLACDLYRAHSANWKDRISQGRRIQMHRQPLKNGNPEHINIIREVEVITEETKRHFRLFKSPFINDVLEEKDIYMSDEHHYIEAAMVDAAKHAGFLAIVGEVQSGK
jgi:hypothetical protein